MPTEQPPLLGEVVPTFADRGCRVVSATDPPDRILGFLDRSRYYFFQEAPQTYSRGWVDPVPDPLLLRKSESAGNRTQDLWICSQKLWPLDNSHHENYPIIYCHVISVALDGSWIGSRTYWTLYNSWLHLTNHYNTKPGVLSHVASRKFLCFRAHVLAAWRPSHVNLILPLIADSGCLNLNSVFRLNSVPKVKDKVTLRPMISRSIRPWCWDPSGSHDRILIILISVWHLLFCRCRAPPLTRGRVCYLY
jgi:hypothetical protein